MIALKKKSNLWNLHFIYSKTSKPHKYYSENISNKINSFDKIQSQNHLRCVENTFMGPKLPEQET